jgi:integrase
VTSRAISRRACADSRVSPCVDHRSCGVGVLLRTIDDYSGSFVTKSALRLAPLVFVRSGELRMAEWSEFDFEKQEWRIPAARMKMRATHIVNDKLKNLPSKGKLRILRESKHPLDEALKAKNWNDEGIRKRTRALSKLLHDKILKV